MVIRTSIIVGFPGETEEDFEALLEGVKTARFNHLGIFRYSDEEGTPAFKLNPKVPQELIEERFDRLYEVQKEIARELNQQMVGKIFDVVIEGEHEETDLLIKARHAGQAPDIDGNVLINDTNGAILKVGDFVKVRITESLDFDLVGKVELAQ